MKLLGVEASAVADGVPHVVLNLLWNIISFFQVRACLTDCLTVCLTVCLSDWLTDCLTD